MKSKNRINQIIALITLLIIVLVIDILIRIFYTSGIYLQFDSQEFTNISTPIISLFGFIAVIITIYLTASQNRITISQNYLRQHQDYLNKFLLEIKKNEEFVKTFTNSELLNFYGFVVKKYESIKDDIRYRTLLQLVRDEQLTLLGSHEDLSQKELTQFKLCATMLYRELNEKTFEIYESNKIVPAHKNILLKDMIGEILGNYIAGCQEIIENNHKIIDELVIAVDRTIESNPKAHYFFDDNFFKLYNYISKTPELIKYYY